MDIKFKTKNDKQFQAAQHWLANDIEQILYGGAKYGGKSFLGASLIFGDALIYPETRYFIARKELIDLRIHTIPTIHEVFKNFGIDFDKYASYNGQDHVFNLYNKSQVYLLACKEEPRDPLFERFGSMQMTRGWEEEAGEIAEAAHNNLWLSVGRWKNEEYGLKKKLLITANPKKGWLKREFVDPFKQDLLAPTKRFVSALPTDNPYASLDYLKTLSGIKDKVARERLWEGNWDYDEDMDALVSYDALSDAFSNTITKDGEKYLIVDVARKGQDSTVFTYWDGLEKYKIDKFQKQTTDITEQKIKDAASAHRIPYSHILIDEDGIGGGIVDHLKGVKGFTANSTPIPTATVVRERQQKLDHFLVPKTVFSNLKAQCGWKLAELINEHKIAFKVPEYRDEILEDLTAILRDKAPDSEGKKRLRPKDEVKEEIGHSPDVGDALLMRAYFELVKESSGQDDQMVKQAMQEQEIVFSRNKENQTINSSK